MVDMEAVFHGAIFKSGMTIYRADPRHGVAWITGASTGIGRALALDLAGAGYTVAVTAREQDAADSLLAEAAAKPGKILSFPCDVTDESAMARTVASIEAAAGPIVLAIFNAGTYLPAYGEALSLPDFHASYAVNVFGVLNGLVPTVERMKARSRGHIVIMGSITAYFGMPTTAAYGATKAALNHMAEALRYDFGKMNIRIQVFNPGFVDTPLAARVDFKKPGLIPVQEASSRMVRAIRTGGFEVTFPRKTTWLMKLVRHLPDSIVVALVNLVSRWPARPLMPGRRPKD